MHVVTVNVLMTKPLKVVVWNRNQIKCNFHDEN